MTPRAAALLLAAAAMLTAPACSQDRKENPIMNKKAPPGASRPPPPEVAPVEFQGVRYQPDRDAMAHGGDQPGGYLVALDAATGARLWMLKVYTIGAPSRPDVPVFGRYFKRMTLLPDRNALEIENEVGGVYHVDLAARTSTWVSGPDSKRP